MPPANPRPTPNPHRPPNYRGAVALGGVPSGDRATCRRLTAPERLGCQYVAVLWSAPELPPPGCSQESGELGLLGELAPRWSAPVVAPPPRHCDVWVVPDAGRNGHLQQCAPPPPTPDGRLPPHPLLAFARAAAPLDPVLAARAVGFEPGTSDAGIQGASTEARGTSPEI